MCTRARAHTAPPQLAAGADGAGQGSASERLGCDRRNGGKGGGGRVARHSHTSPIPPSRPPPRPLSTLGASRRRGAGTTGAHAPMRADARAQTRMRSLAAADPTRCGLCDGLWAGRKVPPGHLSRTSHRQRHLARTTRHGSHSARAASLGRVLCHVPVTDHVLRRLGAKVAR